MFNIKNYIFLNDTINIVCKKTCNLFDTRSQFYSENSAVSI